MLTAHEDIDVLVEAKTAEHSLKQLSLMNPDIVITDLSMPGMGGMALTRRLHEETEAYIIAFSMHKEPEYVQSPLEAGGTAYVPKSSVQTALLNAIAAVSRGNTMHQPACLLISPKRWLRPIPLKLYSCPDVSVR